LGPPPRTRSLDTARVRGGAVRHDWWHRCQGVTREPYGIPSAPRRVLWVTVLVPRSPSPQTGDPFRTSVLPPSYACSNRTARAVLRRLREASAEPHVIRRRRRRIGQPHHPERDHDPHQGGKKRHEECDLEREVPG